jgi:hypothetical protein
MNKTAAQVPSGPGDLNPRRSGDVTRIVLLFSLLFSLIQPIYEVQNGLELS